MALVGAVAVAQARNISGGVNPSAELPGAPQPFWLEGPLEPPFGRYFHNLVRSRELTPISRFTRVNQHSYWRAIAFWNVYCYTLACQLLCTGQDRVGREKGDLHHHHLQQVDPRTLTLLQDHCAFSYAKEVVIITDEPALVAEPGWLLSSRLAR